jgi:hypothetical protein
MAQALSIECTEVTHSKRSFEAKFQLFRNNYIFGCNPLEYITVFFRGITSYASWNNVLNFSVAAFTNWHNMVKAHCHFATISTLACKLRQNLNLYLRLDRFSFSFSAMGVLLAFAAVSLVCRIAKSCVFSFVGFAQSIFCQQSSRQPLFTLATPAQAFLRHKTPLTDAEIVRFGYIGTITAFAFQAVKTRTIFSERHSWFPLLASCTSFQTRFDKPQVLSHGNSDFFRRTLYRPVFSLCHCSSSFDLLNYNMRRSLHSVE